MIIQDISGHIKRAQHLSATHCIVERHRAAGGRVGRPCCGHPVVRISWHCTTSSIFRRVTTRPILNITVYAFVRCTIAVVRVLTLDLCPLCRRGQPVSPALAGCRSAFTTAGCRFRRAVIILHMPMKF